jgi:NTP pyrophosphatase (non-canonical NTP hydrolase)
MNFSEYQQLALRTARSDQSLDIRRLIATLGLAGEAGEVAELVKKQIGHGHNVAPEQVAKELGDALWYTALVATLYDLDLQQIARENIEKLRRRYPEGFSSSDSISRQDVSKDEG